MHGSLGEEGGWREASHERFNQLLHAVLQRGEKRRRRLVLGPRQFLAGSEQGTAQTAMSALHFGEAGKHGAHAEAGSLSAIDSGEERVGEAVDHLRAVMSLDQGGYAFIAIGGAGGMEQFLRHAEFGGPGKKRRESGGQDFGWHHEDEAGGHGNEPAADEDIGFAIGVVRTDELITQTEGAAKVGGPGLFGDEGIRAGFNDAAIDVCGAENAAEFKRRFIKDVLDSTGGALFFEGEGGAESGNAAADDGDAGHGKRLPAAGFWLPEEEFGIE